MDPTGSAEIIKVIQSDSNFFKNYGGLIGTFIASLTALFIAGGGGRWLIGKVYKPNLRVTGNIQRYRQAHHVWRIPITNEGNDTAEDVQAVVTKFQEGKKGRKNFVPMPLAWTHSEADSRDILPRQTVYLDIIEHNVNSKDKEANLASPRGHGVSDFRNLKVSEEMTTLEVTIYEKRGKVLKTHIEIGWPQSLFFDARVRGKGWVLGIFKTKGGK